MNTENSPVTVIGLGPMGQAMARVLLDNGHPVTVWNRTAARAEPLLAAGARLTATPGEALAAAELVLLSLTDYRAMYDILDTFESDLDGRTLVNLSSDDPDVTRRAAAWADRNGASLVAGGVMVPAPMVGTDSAYVYYSGPTSAFETHRPVLRLLGAPRYLGADAGLAPLFYVAQLNVFLSGLSALLQSVALVRASGVAAADFLPDALRTLTETGAMLGTGGDTAAMLDAGTYPGELATAAMMGATADHIVSASRAAGVDLALPQAVKSHYDRAIAAGHGGDSWMALLEVVKKPEA